MTCESCERTKNITLQNGDISCSYCEKWRDETLLRSQTARNIVRMEEIEDRRDAVDRYGKNHGNEAKRRLTDHIANIWHDRLMIRMKK